MISLLMGNLCRIPYMVMWTLLGVCALCSCFRLSRFRVRDWGCFKRLLRWSGHDHFDDFELLILVHEVVCDHKKEKLKTFIRVIAGCHVAETDPSSRGIFQQPLHIFVEQGTARVSLELLEEPSQRLLARAVLETERDILKTPSLEREQVIAMQLKGRGVQNPRLKLTMMVSDGHDAEQGLLTGHQPEGMADDTRILMHQQLRKAESQQRSSEKSSTYRGGSSSSISSTDINEEQKQQRLLKQACAGPLDVFEGFGATRRIYCGVKGPPEARGWALGIWPSKEECDRGGRPWKEIDLRRIKCVGADPQRSNVFLITYFDQRRDQQKLMLRIVDLNRDVWVHMLLLLIKKAHTAHKTEKERAPKKQTR